MQLVDARTGIRWIEEPECLRLLAARQVGRLGFVLGGGPEVLPINYVLDGDAVVFATAEGSKLRGATRRARGVRGRRRRPGDSLRVERDRARYGRGGHRLRLGRPGRAGTRPADRIVGPGRQAAPRPNQAEDDYRPRGRRRPEQIGGSAVSISGVPDVEHG
jgi:Pyridoxamine 5'-phosphate oxidase